VPDSTQPVITAERYGPGARQHWLTATYDAETIDRLCTVGDTLERLAAAAHHESSRGG
jgi:hypothetical protein